MCCNTNKVIERLLHLSVLNQDQFYIFFVGDVSFNRLQSTLLFYPLCPLTPSLDKDHTQRVTKVFIQCVPEDNAREGRMSSAENQGAGKRQR